MPAVSLQPTRELVRFAGRRARAPSIQRSEVGKSDEMGDAIHERPAAREKLALHGTEALSDAELLAVLWRSGTVRTPVLAMAQRAIVELGGLRGVLTASRDGLRRIPGIGPARAAQAAVVMELARRCLLATLTPRVLLGDPGAAKRYFLAWLRDRRQEVFAALFLDGRHRVIVCDRLWEGTIDGASVYPREVVLRAVEIGAAAVIFAHNHPSGVAEPSDADRRMTRRLRDALSLVDVQVLDHLVVGDGEVTSFAERGLL